MVDEADDLLMRAQPRVAEEIVNEVEDIVMGWLSSFESAYKFDTVGMI